MRERGILQALKESEERERALCHVYKLQAANILNNLYCAKIHRQLGHHEKTKEKKMIGRLMGYKVNS